LYSEVGLATNARGQAYTSSLLVVEDREIISWKRKDFVLLVLHTNSLSWVEEFISILSKDPRNERLIIIEGSTGQLHIVWTA
jgi:hypothetical protein